MAMSKRWIGGRSHRALAVGVALVPLLVLSSPPATSQTAGNAAASPVTSPAHTPRSAGARLVAAYPDHLARVDGDTLVWTDGTRMPLDDGQGVKSFADWLERPDLEDMLQWPYPAGAAVTPPAENDDPGRARNAAFFDKMYGDCRRGEVAPRLVEVVWLPMKAGQRFKVTSVNGVASRLEAVSRALDALPDRFDTFLSPAAGTYNCRVIAGTSRVSAHGHGIAIDISVKHADYWRWSKPLAGGRQPFRNQIPREIVDIFEAHGFIWGGRWYHSDTMHFEYRPELMPAAQTELMPKPLDLPPPRP